MTDILKDGGYKRLNCLWSYDPTIQTTYYLPIDELECAERVKSEHSDQLTPVEVPLQAFALAETNYSPKVLAGREFPVMTSAREIAQQLGGLYDWFVEVVHVDPRQAAKVAFEHELPHAARIFRNGPHPMRLSALATEFPNGQTHVATTIILLGAPTLPQIIDRLGYKGTLESFLAPALTGSQQLDIAKLSSADASATKRLIDAGITALEEMGIPIDDSARELSSSLSQQIF